MKRPTQKYIAIFGSGRGSNARAIVEHFLNHPSISVALIVTDNSKAGIIDVARENRIPFDIISKAELNEKETMLDMLSVYQIDLIVLAGFIRLLPSFIVEAYPDKIINIHPSLLPLHGGKGLYGHKVHQEVIENRETESGITIHYVNENYDEGKIIAQFRCHVEPSDNADTLAVRISELEHFHYPEVIESLLS